MLPLRYVDECLVFLLNSHVISCLICIDDFIVVSLVLHENGIPLRYAGCIVVNTLLLQGLNQNRNFFQQ